MSDIEFKEIYPGTFELHMLAPIHMGRRAFRFTAQQRDEYLKATPTRRVQIISAKKAANEFVWLREQV
jgi:hypothetical protein